jgi:hypothetical protein
MRSDYTRSLATMSNYIYAVSLCGISSTGLKMKCVSQTVDISSLNLGSSYSEMDIPCLNSSNVLKTVYLSVEHVINSDYIIHESDGYSFNYVGRLMNLCRLLCEAFNCEFFLNSR